MSKYTTEVRWICEYEAQQATHDKIPEGFPGIETNITLSAPRIFNFDFPIFDENYRLVLEKKILRHFYTREICEETVGLWKLRLWDKLNVVMPYYNKLYESELLEFNPFYDVNVTRDRTGSNEGTNQSVESENYINSGSENKNKNDNTSGNKSTVADSNNQSISNNRNSEVNSTSREEENTGWKLFSDTPQGGVLLIDNTDPNTVAGNAYLTNATKDTNNTDESISNTSNTEGNENKNDIAHGTSNENIETQNNTKEVNERSNTGENYRNVSGNISNTEEYLEHVIGKQGHHTYSAMLMEFRKTLLNIDEMVLRELEDLFFRLW